MYMDTTTKGNSGSPVYTHDITGSKALAVGVHVAGHTIANTAVPLMFHPTLMTIQEKVHRDESTIPMDSPTFQSKFEHNILFTFYSFISF